MNSYTIYCTEEQTRRAYKLGAPINKADILDDLKNQRYFFCDYGKIGAIVPTAEQMIGWLRSRGMKFYFNDITSLWQVVYDINIIGQGCSDNKELAAIDAALEYLEKKGGEDDSK